MVATPDTTVASPHKFTAHQRKVVFAAAIGNVVEWVDWGLYAVFVKIISQEFFPVGDSVASLLTTLGFFAIGFIMRPVGAAILGSYADKFGRKKGLILSIALMSGSALVMALTPSYAVIGVWATAILLVCRLVQGFSAGGEFGASSALLVESAGKGRRAFAGSWQQVSVAGGTLIASFMGTVFTWFLSPEALLSWGWRAAFLVGAALGLIGIWLRVSVNETESFVSHKPAVTSKVHPLKAMIFHHPKAALRVAGITIAGTLTYYIWLNYLPTYANITTGIPLKEAFLSQTISIAVFMVLLPFAGMLSDRIGRKKTLGAFAVCFILFSYPLLAMLSNNFWSLLFVQLAGIVFLLGYSCNCAAIMAEQFPPEVRATGIALPYALAVAIFGGTAPYVTTWMHFNGFINYIWLYVALAALISLVVYMRMPETNNADFE